MVNVILKKELNNFLIFNKRLLYSLRTYKLI